MFEAKSLVFEEILEEKPLEKGSLNGRAFAVSGGVAKSVVDVISRLDPEREVKVVAAQGLKECKKLLLMAKAGKYNGYLLEGMACPGGCVAGAGTLLPVNKATMEVNKYAAKAPLKNPVDDEYQIDLPMLN